MVWWWWILPAAVAVAAVATILGALGWLVRGHPLKGLSQIVIGLALGVAGLVAALVGLDIQTYHRLTSERPVATIELHRKANRLFDATLTQAATQPLAAAPPAAGTGAGDVSKVYEIHGDEWRLEARLLKWKSWANVLGLDTQYRLDRLSGRYEDTESELHAERSVYDLRPPAQPGMIGKLGAIDLWQVARKSSRSAPVVDALYGGGVFMPMADGAKYEIWIAQSGLVARPSNPAAIEASGSGWH